MRSFWHAIIFTVNTSNLFHVTINCATKVLYLCRRRWKRDKLLQITHHHTSLLHQEFVTPYSTLLESAFSGHSLVSVGVRLRLGKPSVWETANCCHVIEGLRRLPRRAPVTCLSCGIPSQHKLPDDCPESPTHPGSVLEIKKLRREKELNMFFKQPHRDGHFFPNISTALNANTFLFFSPRAQPQLKQAHSGINLWRVLCRILFQRCLFTAGLCLLLKPRTNLI